MAPLYNPIKIHGQIIWRIWCQKEPTTGVEAPAIPDVVDVVDVGFAAQGLAVDKKRRVRRVRRVEVPFYFFCPSHKMERVSK